MSELFCCKCATKCIKSMKHGQIREHCPNCGFIYFRNPIPGVAVILTDGEKIALGKRGDTGKWCIPCGHIEYGESFIDAAIREVKEEIGIDSEPLKIINVESNNLLSNSFVTIVILSKPLSYELYPADGEMTETKWFDINGLMPELEFDGDNYIIGKLKENLLSKTEISGIFLSERQSTFIKM